MRLGLHLSPAGKACRVQVVGDDWPGNSLGNEADAVLIGPLAGDHDQMLVAEGIPGVGHTKAVHIALEPGFTDHALLRDPTHRQGVHHLTQSRHRQAHAESAYRSEYNHTTCGFGDSGGSCDPNHRTVTGAASNNGNNKTHNRPEFPLASGPFRPAWAAVGTLAAMSTPQPGWYPDPQDTSLIRWWDGQQWSSETQPADEPLAGLGTALLKRGREMLATRSPDVPATRQDAITAATGSPDGTQFSFKSHVTGLDGIGVPNATVTIHEDFIEYDQPKSISGGRVAAAVATGGLSLVAGGVRSHKSGGTMSLPIKRITSVSTKNDGFRFVIMSVASSGGVISFRSTKEDIARAQAMLADLMLHNRADQQRTAAPAQQTQQVVVNVSSPSVTSADSQSTEPTPADQLLKLKDLFDAGVLTAEEYEAKRAPLIAQL